MSDTGSMMWFIATAIGVLAILAGFVFVLSRKNPYQHAHRHSRWPSGPWP